MRKREAFLRGAFGSIVPEVLRYYHLVVEQQKEISLPHLPIYLLLNLVFVIVAGVFTIAWKPENTLKAVWVGASFPTLFATLVATAPKIPGS